MTPLGGSVTGDIHKALQTSCGRLCWYIAPGQAFGEWSGNERDVILCVTSSFRAVVGISWRRMHVHAKDSRIQQVCFQENWIWVWKEFLWNTVLQFPDVWQHFSLIFRGNSGNSWNIYAKYQYQISVEIWDGHHIRLPFFPQYPASLSLLCTRSSKRHAHQLHASDSQQWKSQVICPLTAAAVAIKG